MNKDASYFKYYGDDSGVVKIGGKWIKFKCLTCVKNWLPLKFKGEDARWQGPPSGAIIRALAKQTGVECMGPQIHNKEKM
jgi:hypothetical protein